MKNFNQIAIEGYLVRDPEMTYFGTENKEICKFSIGVNGYKEGHVNFFNCVCFNGLAKIVAQYCKKGSHVLIGGELKNDRWTDDQGQNKSMVSITCNEVKFLNSRSVNDNTENNQDFPQDPQDEAPF